MKKVLSLFMSVLMLLCVFNPVGAFAAVEDDYAFSTTSPTTVKIVRYNGTDPIITIPASSNGKSVTSIGAMAFYGNDTVMNVTTPSTLETISGSAFGGCINLRFVTLNEGLTSIGDGAFDGCIDLYTINIPSTVESIGDGVFYSDKKITNFSVHKDNKYYCFDGSALYDINKTHIIKYLSQCSNTMYSLPRTVATIDGYAMEQLANLKTLGIPKSVKTIKDYAFNEVTTITDIYYEGTESEWAEVTKGSGNSILTTATLHFEELPECSTHKWDGGVVTKETSCKEPGITTYTCNICYSTKEEKIAALEHTWNDGVVTTQPTCTEQGEKTFTCTECGATKKEPVDVIDHEWETNYRSDEDNHWHKCQHCDATKDVAAHTWNDGVVTTQPTCTEQGEKTFTCTACNVTKTEPVNPLNHDWLEEWNKNEDNHWHKCSRCDATTEPEAHTWDEGVVTEESSCTEGGEMLYTCTKCKATKTEPIAILDHEWETNYRSDENNHWYKCQHCNATKDAAAHTWDEGVVTTQPTCTAEGEKTFTCTVCNATKTEPVNPLDHDWQEEWDKDANNHWHKCSGCEATTEPKAHTWDEGEVTKAPSCKVKGEITYTCTVCGATKTSPIDKTENHKWDDGEVTKQPTCKDAGVITYKCTVCGFTKPDSIPKTDKHTVVTDKAVPATFKKTGLTKGKHCSVCGKVIIKQKTVAKLGKAKITKLIKGKKRITVKWNRVKSVHGYQIQYSTSKSFDKKDTVRIKKQKKTKTVIKKLQPGKKYYFRIRAYKVINGKMYYSKWSKIKAQKTEKA